MSDILVSIITVAIVATIVTRPGVAESIMRMSHFASASIQAMLGVDSE